MVRRRWCEGDGIEGMGENRRVLGLWLGEKGFRRGEGHKVIGKGPEEKTAGDFDPLQAFCRAWERV